ncbi:MAG: steroid delta-isomerase, partial [Flavobacteriaceae bacterium]|nr:steroid delta-isomerase [Flavobacteriaceae bacterium]
MKALYFFLFATVFNLALGQQTPPDTEVFLFEIKNEDGKVVLANGKNISKNEGYDNQPYFLDNEYVLFSSNRNGQTDIARYYIKYDSKSWLNFTPGSEYSPIKIPNENAVSSINLETDGTQKLFKYSLSTGQGSVLVDDIVIGYQLWHDQNTLISAVLENEGLSLYRTDMATGVDTRLAEKIGRSLNHIPSSNLISYISKATDKWEIRSMDITNGNSKLITNTLEGSEDMVWYRDAILMGKGSKLYIFQNNLWKEWADLTQRGITNITRLAINKDNDLIAIVGESNGSLINSDDDVNVASSPS